MLGLLVVEELGLLEAAHLDAGLLAPYSLLGSLDAYEELDDLSLLVLAGLDAGLDAGLLAPYSLLGSLGVYEELDDLSHPLSPLLSPLSLFPHRLNHRAYKLTLGAF